MGDISGFQQRQTIGNGDAVVTTQSGATGEQINAIVGQVQTVSLKVDGTVLVLLTDHVHMTLDDNGGMILVSRSAVFPDDHIV